MQSNFEGRNENGVITRSCCEVRVRGKGGRILQGEVK